MIVQYMRQITVPLTRAEIGIWLCIELVTRIAQFTVNDNGILNTLYQLLVKRTLFIIINRAELRHLTCLVHRVVAKVQSLHVGPDINANLAKVISSRNVGNNAIAT